MKQVLCIWKLCTKHYVYTEAVSKVVKNVSHATVLIGQEYNKMPETH